MQRKGGLVIAVLVLKGTSTPVDFSAAFIVSNSQLGSVVHQVDAPAGALRVSFVLAFYASFAELT